METLIEHFGYVAILLGTFLEGETILILAGFAASRGYLDPSLVVLTGCAGTLFGDQLFYYIGRRNRRRHSLRRPSWQAKLAKAQELIKRHRILIILGFRFLYGMRTVTPFALGLAGVRPRLYVPLNLLGAIVWSVTVACAGYFFGHAMERFFGRMKQVELWVMAGIAVCGALAWLIHLLRTRR